MDQQKKKILGIPGSTKESSTHINLIQAFAKFSEDLFDITIFKGLGELPHFNPDLDYDNPPEKVIAFRKLLQEADGILICTPEYAMGVPGSLKNAIDWTVSSCEFSHKPTALITAGLSGYKAHAALMETLKIIEAKITEKTELVIPFIKTKINSDAKIADEKTHKEITSLIEEFNNLMNEQSQLMFAKAKCLAFEHWNFLKHM